MLFQLENQKLQVRHRPNHPTSVRINVRRLGCRPGRDGALRTLGVEQRHGSQARIETHRLFDQHRGVGTGRDRINSH